MERKIFTSIIFSNLRALNACTPQDTYLFNYLDHLKKSPDFYDQYMLAFETGATKRPKKILEIGTRSGISLIQLLSAYTDFSDLRVCLFDVWTDGLCDPDLVRKHLAYMGIPVEPEFYTGDSHITIPEFIKNNTDLFDYLLVDGDHSPEGALDDLENAYKLCAKGGTIVFDDICENDGVKLKPTWETFKERHLYEFKWREVLIAKGTAWAERL